MKHYTDMTSRQKDAWGAEHVMGWVLTNISDNGGHWNQGVESLELVRFVDSWHPSTDASDDYEILKKVRKNQVDGMPILDWEKFFHELYAIQISRAKETWGILYESAAWYEPGDYLHAAWMADNGD